MKLLAQMVLAWAIGCMTGEVIINATRAHPVFAIMPAVVAVLGILMHLLQSSKISFKMKERKFSLGHVVATPGSLDLLHEHGLYAASFIDRHATGDWGDLPPEDVRENEYAVDYDERVLSSYVVSGDRKIWIITEADRSATTILLPEEY